MVWMPELEPLVDLNRASERLPQVFSPEIPPRGRRSRRRLKSQAASAAAPPRSDRPAPRDPPPVAPAAGRCWRTGARPLRASRSAPPRAAVDDLGTGLPLSSGCRSPGRRRRRREVAGGERRGEEIARLGLKKSRPRCHSAGAHAGEAGGRRLGRGSGCARQHDDDAHREVDRNGTWLKCLIGFLLSRGSQAAEAELVEQEGAEGALSWPRPCRRRRR